MTASEDDAAGRKRLERRWDRERRARLEAEAIAEQGLRDLYAANESLDERIRQRTSELEAATRRAEAANKAKGDFLAHVGHELRTPINGIAGMLELLDRVVTDTRAREWLTSARESTDRLERLFDRILWFVELENIDLSSASAVVSAESAVDQAAERWRQPCARAGQLLGVEVSTPLDCTVLASDELARALDELLDNAVQHATQGPVRLRASADGDMIRFSVDDPGPGMEGDVAAAASGVLDPGESPTSRRGAGAGIGLALVQRIAAALGGMCGIDRSELGGSSFWMTVPASGD